MDFLVVAFVAVVFVVWAGILKSLAQSRSNKRKEFYALFFAVPVLSLLLSITALKEFISSTNIVMLIVILGFYLGFVYLWAKFAYDAAGNDKLVWFYLILLIPVMWALYWFTELR